MYHLFQILSILLTAIGLALSLSHALELPGEMRLSVEPYFMVQSIYYPGFTIGGMFDEPGAVMATLVLLLLTPAGTIPFWLILIALAALLLMQGVFWRWVQPLNKVWQKGRELRRPAAMFFDAGRKGEFGQFINQNWTKLRNQWEYSHLVRAGFAMLALIALIISVSVPA